MTSASAFVLKKLRQKQAILFSKTMAPRCLKVKAMLSSTRVLTPELYDVVELEKRHDCSEVQDLLWGRTDLNSKAVPLLFINGVYFGGYDKILALFQEKRLRSELISKLEDVKIRAARLELAKQEEVVIRFRELDTTEITVEIHGLGQEVELDDADANCPQNRWGFDPWDYDDDFDVDAKSFPPVECHFMSRETVELHDMRSDGRQAPSIVCSSNGLG